MGGVKSTRELLAEYAMLLNRYGADSHQAAAFLEEHRGNPEFTKLAQISRALKIALAVTPPAGP